MNKRIRKLDPDRTLNAHVPIPGSKSITHRALMMASLAKGESEIANALTAEDTLLTAKALQQLGVTLKWEEDLVRIIPPEYRWKRTEAPIWLGNSGTSMRLLLSLAAAGEGTFTFDGTERLRERPVGPILEALGNLGVSFRYLRQSGCPPVELVSKGLKGGQTVVDARRSGQFLSSLLMAAPLAERDLIIGWMEPAASFPYVRLTLDMMAEAGIVHERQGPDRIRVPAPQTYGGLRMTVEGDISSASYFWAAAAMSRGRVRTFPLRRASLQGDLLLLDVLQSMGCRVSWDADGVTVEGPPELAPVELDMNAMPDMVPTVAVLAAAAPGLTRLRNVAHLRIKESDRLRALATELTKFDVTVRELPDGLVIHGGAPKPPKTVVDSHDDHRIAMAFAVLGLYTGGVEIAQAETVGKSFPNFWQRLEDMAAASFENKEPDPVSDPAL